MLGNFARGAACALIFLLPAAASAQAATVVSGVKAPGWTDDQAQVRLHYGFAFRNGEESDQGPGLSYSGFSPNDLEALVTVLLTCEHRVLENPHFE